MTGESLPSPIPTPPLGIQTPAPSPPRRAPRKPFRIHPSLRLPLAIIGFLPFLIFFTDNFYHVSWVSGRSMYPTFSSPSTSPTRDLILLKKFRARYNLQKGQIVAYRSPLDPEIVAVKRIVATEGDLVVVKDGGTYGSEETDRSNEEGILGTLIRKKTEVIVPKNCVWVEGDDHRSLDSNTFGPLNAHLIQAKVTRILWPFRRAGALDDTVPAATATRVVDASEIILTRLISG